MIWLSVWHYMSLGHVRPMFTTIYAPVYNNLWFSDVFRGYRKGALTLNWLMNVFKSKETSRLKKILKNIFCWSEYFRALRGWVFDSSNIYPEKKQFLEFEFSRFNEFEDLEILCKLLFDAGFFTLLLILLKTKNCCIRGSGGSYYSDKCYTQCKLITYSFVGSFFLRSRGLQGHQIVNKNVKISKWVGNSGSRLISSETLFSGSRGSQSKECMGYIIKSTDYIFRSLKDGRCRIVGVVGENIKN